MAETTGSGSPAAVDGLRLRHRVTGEESRLDLEGVFMAIGHTPTTAVFQGDVALDAAGYILTEPGSTRISVRGVFAAGDVQDKVWHQAVTAAGAGGKAALELERHLATLAASSRCAANLIADPGDRPIEGPNANLPTEGDLA